MIIVTLVLRASITSPAINDWVLAYSTVTLVFVTIYYAIQTQRLVQQEKLNLDESIKKRHIDFLERKINEFYAPFIDVFNSSWEELHRAELNLPLLWDLRLKSQRLLWDKGYLISAETFKKIDHWLGTLFLAIGNTERAPHYDNHRDSDRDVRKKINEEWAETENKIREFYGVPLNKELPIQR
jgi:hypothetical protein